MLKCAHLFVLLCIADSLVESSKTVSFPISIVNLVLSNVRYYLILTVNNNMYKKYTYEARSSCTVNIDMIQD